MIFQWSHRVLLIRNVNLLFKSLPLPNCPKLGTSKTGYEQVNIMKEFVWINGICFFNLAVGQVDEKKLRQKLLVWCTNLLITDFRYHTSTHFSDFALLFGQWIIFKNLASSFVLPYMNSLPFTTLSLKHAINILVLASIEPLLGFLKVYFKFQISSLTTRLQQSLR